MFEDEKFENGIGDEYSETIDDSMEEGYGEYTEEALDTNGDGIDDFWAVDLDGDGKYDMMAADTDYDGYAESIDVNGDGYVDQFTSFIDIDGDGIVDVMYNEYDSDYNGAANTFTIALDLDDDGIYDVVKTFDYDENTGILELGSLEPITWAPDTVFVEEDSIYDDYENYDPDTANADAVSGNPEESMDEWEFQGDTNRCALYTQMFVIEEMTNENIDMEDFADIAEEQGWFDEEGGTSVLNMNKMLDYYGIENEMSFNNDIDDIKDCLDNGGKVIVSIDADEIWYEDNDNMFTPGESANHAVEVIGIDYSDPENPMVILNDPGHPDGCGAMVPVDDFVDAWEDGNCQMIECM